MTDPSDKSVPSAASAPAASCRIEFRVRYAEVDQMGAVHHSRYWVYFEMGRTELLRRQGVAYADLEREGVFFVVAKCSAKFLAAARYDDLLALTTRIVRMGAARIDHEYELHRIANGQLLCTAQTTLACLDRSGQIAAIPDSIRSPGGPQTPEQGAGLHHGKAQS
jgi:acyl-CoA thioester hydrolase